MGKRQKLLPYQREFDWAVTICAPFGCVVERSSAMFEIAKVKGDGVSLVIYPHKTSANNYHARVRDNGSKDKAKALQVMIALDHGLGLPEKEAQIVRFSCTFTRKNAPLARTDFLSNED